jgi:large subunit ribosomal protein L25
MNEVEIACLPGDLPEFIEVYMAELDLNEIIHLSDLALPNGVTLVALSHEDDRAVVSVLPPRGGAEEEELEAAAEAEVAAEEGEEEGESEDAGDGSDD